MSKKEAIVDTCFFNKLSNDGKNSEVLKKVLTDLDYKPVVHPYIAEKELDMFPHFNKLVEEGFIRKAEYSEFIEDEYDKELLGELNVYDEIYKQPNRKKCALLQRDAIVKMLNRLDEV